MINLALVATAQRPTPAEMGFRPETATMGTQATDVLVILMLLVAAFVAVVWVARKQGWLDRWIVSQGNSEKTRSTIRVEQALRISPRTTVYRIVDAERRYLLVESSAATQIVTIEVTDHAIE